MLCDYISLLICDWNFVLLRDWATYVRVWLTHWASWCCWICRDSSPIIVGIALHFFFCRYLDLFCLLKHTEYGGWSSYVIELTSWSLGSSASVTTYAFPWCQLFQVWNISLVICYSCLFCASLRFLCSWYTRFEAADWRVTRFILIFFNLIYELIILLC